MRILVYFLNHLFPWKVVLNLLSKIRFYFGLLYCSLKNEIEQLQAEHTEDVVQLQQKYKLEIDLLKDQLLESDARNESLEQEVKQKFYHNNPLYFLRISL